MAAQNTCLQCGAPLEGDAREEFCPKCLFQEANAGLFGPGAEADAEQEDEGTEDKKPEDRNEQCEGRGGRIKERGPRREGRGQKAQEPLPLAPGHPPLPSSFGDYELLAEIGRGGMGVVYRARQRSLDRMVALKMIAFGPGSSPELIKRFRTEAVSAASLHHPNIVAIHEVGIHQERHFFVMDYVEGQSLAALVGNQPLPAKRAAAYLETVAEAVHYAHERGILHRDLKPSNVLIDAQDQPRVVDFGLARRLEGESDLTVTGQVLGSPQYLPPEQAMGKRGHASRRTDVYALGATLYHLLTGRAPFQAETMAQTLNLVLHSEVIAPRLLNPSVPRDLETICLKCLEKEPARRYATARELADELARFQAGEPIHARPLGAAGQTWRWCRRNPRLAGALGLAVLSLLIGLTGVTWQWRHAELQRRRAEDGELLARRNAYAADMKEVQRAIEDNDLGRARVLLDRHRPQGKFETDLRSWEWRYFWGRCQSQERFMLHQYSNSVSALACSPDGKWLAVRLGTHAVALWDTMAQRPMAELPAYGRRYCKALAFSPRGNVLAWGNRDGTTPPVVSLRDLDTQNEMPPLPHSHPVASLAFSPDAKTIATLAYDGTVRLWNLGSQQVITQFLTAPVDIQPDRFSARTKLMDTPRADTAPQDEKAEGRLVLARYRGSAVFTDHYGVVLFSPDERWLAIGEADPRIRLLDRTTGQERVIPLPPPADGITALAFSPDGQKLAAGGGAGDNDIQIWDLADSAAGTPPQRLTGHGGWIAALAFSPDGRALASASSDQTVRLWEFTTPTAPRNLQGNKDEVWAIHWSANGANLVTGARDGSVRYWDPTNKPAAPYEVLPEAVHLWAPAFFPDSKTFLTTSRADGTVTRWDTESLRVVERLSFLGSNHTSLGLSPDGRWLALGDDTGDIQLWDFPAHHIVTNLVFPGGDIFALWFSSQGKLLISGAVASNTRIVGKLWTVADWQEIFLPPQATTNLFDGNISPDERTMALGYGNGTAAWWDLASGTRQAFFDCRYTEAAHAVFSPDGRHFATGGMDGLMTLWDVATQQPKPIGRAHRNALHDLLFSPDSQRVLASGTGRMDIVKLWDVETGRDVATLQGEPAWYAHISFSPDGRTLFASSVEGTALLWRAPSFAEIEAKEQQSRPR